MWTQRVRWSLSSRVLLLARKGDPPPPPPVCTCTLARSTAFKSTLTRGRGGLSYSGRNRVEVK